jgi:hypothetical protein
MPGERLAVEGVFEAVAGDLARLILDKGVEELPVGDPLSIVSGSQKDVQASVQSTLLPAAISWSAA